MIEEQYALPEVGVLYAARLRANAAAGRYDRGNWKDLCDWLTADVQAVHTDEHIRINAGPVPKDDQRALGAGRLIPTEAGQWAAPGIAYVRLNRFSGQQTNVLKVRSFLLAHQSAKTLILDLREHRGGRFEEMDAIMPLLFARRTALLDLAMAKTVYDAEGPVITSPSLERVDGPSTLVVRRHYANPDRVNRGLRHTRVFLLTSQRTASAAEHFALALKRTHRATLIGEPTAGADHFGEMVAITDHFNVFLPIGRTYDPVTGKDWESVGVKPDIAAPAGDALAIALEQSGIGLHQATAISKRIEARLSAPVD
jgi:C-terminal processing protease CtpA/Prc